MRLTKRDRGGNAVMDCGNCEIKYRESCCSLYNCRNALINKLAAYEDLEEQGLLVRLPCKVGDTLYEIDLPEYGVIICKVIYLDYYNGPFAHVPGGKMISTWTAGVEVIEGHGIGSSYAFESVDFGKTVFLTRAEAEAALKGGQGDV